MRADDVSQVAKLGFPLMSFSPGSLVRARGREWVVLPDSTADLLVLRPLGGTDEEVAGVYLPLEHVEPARFDLPDPARVGDHRSGRLLRDAVRLSTRAGAGPFRSFARIAVEPRPYQLVPLLLALRLEPVRLLIADDVGVGKTVEAALIARELLDRGEIHRTAVLCPPHLAEQWQAELRNKFHIEAELVLSGTAARLERGIRVGRSLFELYPHVIVSLDYIKSERRRDEFVRSCPEFVIVDEAHTCAFGDAGRSSRHQRHQLVEALAAHPDRHLVLVTATPHSGKEDAFRSLLTLLDPAFANLPDDLSGPTREADRRRLATHLVQRRRADIRHFLAADTPFPDRLEKEESYKLSPAYARLFQRVLDYARETVADPAGGKHRQRVRWWSALALLRSLASSPAAAAATLVNRAPSADTATPEEADEVGRRIVCDVDLDDLTAATDLAPGADPGEADSAGPADRRRLLEFAREARSLEGDGDAKLVEAVRHLKALLKDGCHPIVFCRFIPTADYLARELRCRLPKDVVVEAVTGLLPPADREARVLALAQAARRVLIATDCLSEGINLQEHFDAVVHYDLAWNPTRHEQRDGRVDRFGQPRKTVRVLTYYGTDNRIDGVVLDVLLRKHRKIRGSLGISVPVPVDTNAVIEAMMEGLLLRQDTAAADPWLPGFEEYMKPSREALYRDWENAAERERRSRTVFAQESIKVDEVAREIAEARAAVGSAGDVERFVLDALRAHGGRIIRIGERVRADLSEVPRSVRDAIGGRDAFEARFELPVDGGVLHLARTHPIVAGLASHVLDSALDPALQGVACRAGAIRSATVARRTTLLLVRFRFDIVTRCNDQERSELAEECRLLAFAGAPGSAEWLDDGAAERLLDAEPAGNILPEQAAGFVRMVVDEFAALHPAMEAAARARADTLLEAHRRVRKAAQLKGVSYRVEPQLPGDVIGVYVYLPAGGSC